MCTAPAFDVRLVMPNLELHADTVGCLIIREGPNNVPAFDVAYWVTEPIDRLADFGVVAQHVAHQALHGDWRHWVVVGGEPRCPVTRAMLDTVVTPDDVRALTDG